MGVIYYINRGLGKTLHSPMTMRVDLGFNDLLESWLEQFESAHNFHLLRKQSRYICNMFTLNWPCLVANKTLFLYIVASTLESSVKTQMKCSKMGLLPVCTIYQDINNL